MNDYSIIPQLLMLYLGYPLLMISVLIFFREVAFGESFRQSSFRYKIWWFFMTGDVLKLNQLSANQLIEWLTNNVGIQNKDWKIKYVSEYTNNHNSDRCFQITFTRRKSKYASLLILES